jgi:hypothetical protein
MYQICATRIHLTRRSQGTKPSGWGKDNYILIYKEFSLRRNPDDELSNYIPFFLVKEKQMKLL